MKTKKLTMTPIALIEINMKKQAGVDTSKPAVGNADKLGAGAIYEMWRKAVTEKHGDIALYSPTLKELGQAKEMLHKFVERNPESELPQFISAIVKNWGSCCSWLAQNTKLFQFGKYPDLPWILLYLAPLTQWYEKKKVALISDKQSDGKKKANPQTPAVGANEAVPKWNKAEESSVGYTYVGGRKYDQFGKVNPTYEDKLVEILRSGGDGMFNIERLEAVLKKKAVDFDVSMERVAQIVAGLA